MTVDSDRTLLQLPLTVAVAVKGNSSGRVGNGSRRAVWWAAENLMPYANRFVLIHVMPKITSIPTPCNFFLSLIFAKDCVFNRRD